MVLKRLGGQESVERGEANYRAADDVGRPLFRPDVDHFFPAATTIVPQSGYGHHPLVMQGGSRLHSFLVSVR